MNIIWVATTGSDTTGNGSQATPYATIEKAVDNFISGDQIRILDGTYTPTDSIVISGKSGSIFAENPGAVTIQPQKTTVHQGGVVILDAERFTLQGFNTLQAANSVGNLIGIYVENVENFICYTCAVSEFEVPSGNCHGMFASGSLGRIEKCMFYNLSGAGQHLYGVRTIGIDVIDTEVFSLSGAGDCIVTGIKETGLKGV